ncbi:MAG: ATP-binding cassette domain-containing protein [Ardenticatenaceae bacterium]|nr:ATP-binding cassette domain-containing protein [Ardenticatenaceae bacterium]
MSETIRLSGLERHFERGETAVQALRGLDLTIQPGECVALVGPSGSGKSTLLNLLGGLDRPSTGELWLDGVPLHTAGEKERTDHRRQRVGFIFQSFNLLPRLTALENVAVPLMLAGVGRAEREARAAELLQQVGLGHRLDHYPSELSGGEQQRTAVARALIHHPALILADEPTGNLDSITGDEVMALLRDLNKKQHITLVVVTHDPDVAAYADRVVRLRDGQIAAIEGEYNPNGQVSVVEGGTAVFPNGNPGLRFSDIVQSAFNNLRRRVVRNFLTAAGVLIGIVTLVAMVSMGVGVQREVQRNFQTIGLENIFVSPKYQESGDGFDPFAEPDVVTPITPDLVTRIAALDGVASVQATLDLPNGIDLNMVWDGQEIPVRSSNSFGMGRSGGPFNPSEILAGHGFEDNNVQGLIISDGLADELLTAGQTYDDLIGQSVKLVVRLPRGETNEFGSAIVGIRQSFSGRLIDLGLAEREAIKAWWFGQPDILQSEGYDGLTVRAADLSQVGQLADIIQSYNLETQTLEAILEAANDVLSLMQALLGSVGGLALLVAALGVANTMMMAIYERTREIGVLKALGATRREIRAMFTVEAGLIGLIGGFFGLILGTLLGRLVDWIAHRYLLNEGVTGVGQLSVVPLWLALGSLAFAALIGIVAGLYPASRAAKLDPVTALRHE